MVLLRSGVSLFVDDAGGRGRPVLFQHGLGGDASQTREVFPADPSLRRVTLECRCHGRSEAGPVDAFSLASFADDAAALVEELQPPLIVGGISMGAAIALRLAVRRPDLVKALILARPAWVDAPAPDNLAATRLVADLLASHSTAKAAELFDQTPVARDLAVRSPDNLASLRGYFSRPDIGVFRSVLAAIAADGPGVGAAEIATIRVPALVIGTADDSLHPLAHARRLAKLIRRAELREIASKTRSRHDYLAAFREAVTSFCRGVQ